MRVVHIEAGRHLYGGARQVLYLIDGLQRRGVRNVLLCPIGSEIAAAARGQRHSPALDADVIELPMRGDLDLGLARRIGCVLKARRPDIVHVHSRRGADLFGGLAAARGGHTAVLTRRVDGREWAPWARLKYRPYAAVVAISRAIESELLEHVRLPRARVHHVPSGVDTRTFRPDPEARGALLVALGLPANVLLAGVVSQLIPRKGHASLLDALEEPLRRHPRLRIVLFGKGPLEERLRSDVEQRGIGGQVVFGGFRTDLDQLVPGLDLMLHPARAEGLGLAVLEAMSSGVSVVAAAVGGVPDIIDDGVDGVLRPPDDAPAWASTIDRLVVDSKARERLASAARRRVVREFGVQRMVEGNLAVYEALLARAAPGGSTAAGSAAAGAPAAGETAADATGATAADAIGATAADAIGATAANATGGTADATAGASSSTTGR